jgi:carboxypeptidase C (cathepsin A)
MENLLDFSEKIPSQTTNSEEIERIEEKLNEIISDFIPNAQPFTITLMKTNPKTGKNEQLTVWEGEAPLTPHEIGTVYGGGKYDIVIKGKGSGRRAPINFKGSFTLSGHYDKISQKQDVVSSPNGHSDFLSMMLMQQSENQKMMQMMMQTMTQSMAQIMTAMIGLQRPSGDSELMKSLVTQSLTANNERANIQYEGVMNAFNNGLKLGQQAVKSTESINWQEVIQDVVEKAPDILGSIFSPRTIRNRLMRDPRTAPIFEDPQKIAHLKASLEEAHGHEKAGKIIRKAGLEQMAQAVPSGEKSPATVEI